MLLSLPRPVVLHLASFLTDEFDVVSFSRTCKQIHYVLHCEQTFLQRLYSNMMKSPYDTYGPLRYLAIVRENGFVCFLFLKSAKQQGAKDELVVHNAWSKFYALWRRGLIAEGQVEETMARCKAERDWMEMTFLMSGIHSWLYDGNGANAGRKRDHASTNVVVVVDSIRFRERGKPFFSNRFFSNEVADNCTGFHYEQETVGRVLAAGNRVVQFCSRIIWARYGDRVSSSFVALHLGGRPVLSFDGFDCDRRISSAQSNVIVRECCKAAGYLLQREKVRWSDAVKFLENLFPNSVRDSLFCHLVVYGACENCGLMDCECSEEEATSSAGGGWFAMTTHLEPSKLEPPTCIKCGVLMKVPSNSFFCRGTACARCMSCLACDKPLGEVGEILHGVSLVHADCNKCLECDQRPRTYAVYSRDDLFCLFHNKCAVCGVNGCDAVDNRVGKPLHARCGACIECSTPGIVSGLCSDCEQARFSTDKRPILHKMPKIDWGK
jgi:hypothetical protein